MKEPVCGPCNHSFEKACTQTGIIVIREEESFKCPVCRKDYPISQYHDNTVLKTEIAEYTIRHINKENRFATSMEIEEPNPLRASASGTLTPTKKPSIFQRLLGRDHWAKFTMLHDLKSSIDLMKDEYLMGRSSQCEIRFKQVEVSGKHCKIFRVMRPGSETEFDVFIEDMSTNGTFVNGERIAKNTFHRLNHLDEVSLGRRFSSQDYPNIQTFLDMTFFGIQPNSPKHEQVLNIKSSFGTFSKLLNFIDKRIKVLV
ncbi:Forkhead-associated (FHA) domain-containing protein [Rozella allomycis CSF55]|uniref:Forkhead-associated (FHA) domain-containing protein n=1 Tax=Rozella allomycis (strain CSF55) TaxID=988480 RepID=A0A075ARG9_ROZAC|nr:Forkhead-associated (FHA) domain-containing protein [Rozella allomycis CSF55]|eukprot:EPZ32775.1 Forkhead-associated (FHA) domain-containing protein [Rozella allomycis CSF55]